MTRTCHLKLKPSKCNFIRQEVEYLVYLFTPNGLRHNHARVAAVQRFSVPESVTQVRQLLVLTSYHRRFIEEDTIPTPQSHEKESLVQLEFRASESF